MTPDWAKHAVFYQVFPDRFARSERTVHPPGMTFLPWGSDPALQGFQGGDLYGLAERLGYLADLGVTALYLNPIFSSASNHRYHPYSYFEVDPLLGGEAAFRYLLDEAHRRGMKVVLDGVFNHASRGFWAFHHILECGGTSPYIDWFTVERWPLRPYRSTPEHPPNYHAWWNLPALPRLNTDHPAVQEHIYEAARYWLDFGIDGWRLDVPFEITAPGFWEEFRSVCKAANPEAYLVGEVWHVAPEWLRGDRFDALMNYPVAWAALGFFGADCLRPEYEHHEMPLRPLSGADFAEALERVHSAYDWEIVCAQLNLLGSHDTARARWVLSDDTAAFRLCTLLQMTLPGAPCLYYGDEVGMTGGNDPHCRGAFPWHDEGAWDRDLLAFTQRATALRHALPVLRTGQVETAYAGERVVALRRWLESEAPASEITARANVPRSASRIPHSDEALVVFNAARTGARVEVPASGEAYREVWDEARMGEMLRADGGVLDVRISPQSARVLVRA
jgi:neopullulanase